MRTSIAAATMAASLTIGGAAGVTLFTPTITNAAQIDDTSGDTADDTSGEHPAAGERLREVLTPLVEDGTLTETELDAVVETLVEARPDRPHRHRHHLRGPISEAVTDLLGLSRDQIRDLLAEGATLAEVAADQGISEDDLVDTIVAGIEARLDEAVQDGRLSEEEAAEKLANAEERVSEMVDRTFEGRPGRGR